jgi:hypothetical protein
MLYRAGHSLEGTKSKGRNPPAGSGAQAPARRDDVAGVPPRTRDCWASPMPLSDDPTDPFTQFLSAYPQRDEAHDVEAVREAWRRAQARGTDPETLIAVAEAYRQAREGQPAHYTMNGAALAERGPMARCWPHF